MNRPIPSDTGCNQPFRIMGGVESFSLDGQSVNVTGRWTGIQLQTHLNTTQTHPISSDIGQLTILYMVLIKHSGLAITTLLLTQMLVSYAKSSFYYELFCYAHTLHGVCRLGGSTGPENHSTLLMGLQLSLVPRSSLRVFPRLRKKLRGKAWVRG